jgi:hypothetical protein
MKYSQETIDNLVKLLIERYGLFLTDHTNVNYHVIYDKEQRFIGEYKFLNVYVVLPKIYIADRDYRYENGCLGKPDDWYIDAALETLFKIHFEEYKLQLSHFAYENILNQPKRYFIDEIYYTKYLIPLELKDEFTKDCDKFFEAMSNLESSYSVSDKDKSQECVDKFYEKYQEYELGGEGDDWNITFTNPILDDK